MRGRFIMHTKVLVFDIETAPNLAYVWGKYEQNVIDYEREWYMLSFAYKWLGEKTTRVCSLPDYKNFKKDKTDDKALVTELHKLFDQADVIVAHNGDQFDIRKSNARFVVHGLTPPSSYKTVDTKKVAKRYFNFNSNKLDDLGNLLGLGRKLKTGGFDLWLGCMGGDMKAWKLMCTYNKQDVVLLEEVYLKLRGWMTNHPNMNVTEGTLHNCPVCHSHRLQARGYSVTRASQFKRYQCQDCGGWSRGEAMRLGGKVIQ
jgi:DNA polymerase elongation subunit (family B)